MRAAVMQNPALMSGGTPRSLHTQQSLPSLKSSGLLETWHQPEACAQPGAIARADGGPGMMQHHALGQAQVLGRPAPGTMPVGMSWRHADGQ